MTLAQQLARKLRDRGIERTPVQITALSIRQIKLVRPEYVGSQLALAAMCLMGSALTDDICFEMLVKDCQDEMS
jgi:hypothetical protein